MIDMEKLPAGWVVGPGMWRAGFVLDSLELISLMSGFVDVLECVWEDSDNALVFIVRNNDKTNTLFRGGGLCGAPVNSYKQPQQSLFVTASNPARARSMMA